MSDETSKDASRRRQLPGGVSYFRTTSHGREVWRAQHYLPSYRINPGDEKLVRPSVTGTGATQIEAGARLMANYLRAEKKLKDGGGELPEKKVVPRKERKRSIRSLPRGDWWLVEYAKHYTARRKVSEVVKGKEFRTLEMHVLPVLGEVELNDLTTRKIRSFWQAFEVQHENEHGLLRNVHRTLNIFLNQAVKEEAIRSNPLRVIDRPSLPETLTASDMAKKIEKTTDLLAWLTAPVPEPGVTKKGTLDIVHGKSGLPIGMKDGKTVVPRRNYELVCGTAYYVRILLALHGLRPSEALGMTWDQIQLHDSKRLPAHLTVGQVLARDGKTGALRIRQGTKTQRERQVVLADYALDALRKWKREQDQRRESSSWSPRPGLENLVVTLEDGKPYDQNTDQETFQALLKQQQDTMPKDAVRHIFSVGKLRAVSATIQLDAGANPTVIAQAWGHSLEVQQKYYYAGQLRAQVEAFAKSTGLIPTNRNDSDPTDELAAPFRAERNRRWKERTGTSFDDWPMTEIGLFGARDREKASES